MRFLLAGALGAAMTLLAGQAEARESLATTPFDACFERAGAYYRINPLLLRAIARQESSMNPRAFNRNTNGTSDIGLMQINTTHMRKLAKAGVTEQRLWDPCVNIAVGAWVLADAISRHGMTWKAVGVYHSPTDWRQKDYAAKVQRHLVREIRAIQQVVAQQGVVQQSPAAPAAHTGGVAPAIAFPQAVAPQSATAIGGAP